MSHFNDPPRFGATFNPGIDDYYMPNPPPDVVSPAPQRIKPEMPGQIQDSLANLEISGGRNRDMGPASPPVQAHSSSYGSPQQFPYRDAPQERSRTPLPKLKNRTPNVPQSYEEREATLESARPHVLQSTDPDMQLAWAQDALRHVEICSDYETRTATSQSSRPATPQIERQLRTDAFNIVSFLAEQQHPRADFIKGMWLEFGSFGFSQDKPEAFRSYKRAASKGYARAQYRMGLQYESTGESIKALQHYKAGEAADDAAACYRMGMMSLSGQLGQAQDYDTAIRLIRQAADTADENAPQGAYVLGMLIGRELPEIKVPESVLPWDLASARAYIEKAAYLGFAKAQLKMGSAYEMCLFGCDFNPILSLHYNALAARQGEAEAEMAISKWFLCGHEGSFPKDERIAYKYAHRAASYGALPTAQFAMGYFYEIGLSVQSDVSIATDWYEKAAKNGNKDAQGRLDAIAKSRTLSRKDHENVAVTRIKSQYGSRRGGPPPRAGAMASQTMPTIPDDRAGYGRPPQAQQQQAPPGGRITPYPVDDRPPTVAPYPIEDDYVSQRPRPGPAGGFLAVDQRPNSAAADARYNQPPPNQPYYNQQTRPYARSPNPQGRPGPMPSPRPNEGPPGPQGPGPGYRQQTPNTGQGRPAAQGYGPQTGQQSPRPPDRPFSSASGPPAPGRTDHSYSAPGDPRPDQRNRPPATYPSRLDSRLPGSGAPPRQPSPAAPQNTRPKPASSGGPQSNYTMSGGLPPPSPQPPAAASTPTPGGKPSSSKPTGASKPSHGPQTFEEMGVPQGKQDHDCAVM